MWLNVLMKKLLLSARSGFTQMDENEEEDGDHGVELSADAQKGLLNV